MGRMKYQYMPPEKPVLLARCPKTYEALWCEEGPKIRTATITITPPSIHQAEIRFRSATSGEEKTLIRPCRRRMSANRTKVLCRPVDVLVVVKLRMKCSPYRPSTEFRKAAAP